MPPLLKLPRRDGLLAPYTLTGRAPITAPPGPVKSRGRALGACAKGPGDYFKVYGRILAQVREPVIIHWLGDMFDPALEGYWGSRDLDQATETLLAIVQEHAARIDGVKISLLDQAREVAMRKRFPANVRMYTGDDFDYPTTIRGDGDRHSDALLGIFEDRKST